MSRRRARQRAGGGAPSPSGLAGAVERPTAEKPASVEAVEPEALVVSHWFDSGEGSEPYSATIRLTGRRLASVGQPGPRDTFVHEETIERIVPASGPVSVSSWVYGLEPGQWTVAGEVSRPQTAGARRRGRDDLGRRTEPLRPAAWSWRRWGLSTTPAGSLRTRWAPLAPLARIPAVLPGIFTVLGILSIVVALSVQSLLLAHERVPVGPALVASLLAVAGGLVGAKGWYAVLHPGPWRTALLGGWSVDGFLVIAPLVAIAALIAFNLPVGVVLDASAPGILFAVAIGRVGCFFTGCCAGRCTSSRWGIWSSDRRVGARRVPTQLIESAAGLILGLAAVSLLLGGPTFMAGLVFVTTMTVYVVIRQFLLRLRAERREYSWRRSAMAFRDRA